MTFRRPITAWLLALLGCCASCSKPAGLPKIEVEQPLHELLLHLERRTIVEENPRWPVRQDLLRPSARRHGFEGPLPAIELTPPCEVRWEVPRTYPEAVLRFALCVQRGGYQGRGAVHVEVELDGRSVLSHVLPSGEDIRGEDRRWHRLQMPVGSGGALTVRTRYEGDQPDPPRVALGHPRVVVPFEVERQRRSPGHPNVVLIVIDTLRADRLGLYGHQRPVSPVIDSLGERGLVFERAHSTTAWTVPSTASILTGMSPAEHGIGIAESYYLSDSLVTLGEAFQLAGFTTGGFACNPLISAGHNFTQGFEFFEAYDWPHAHAIHDDVAAWLRRRKEDRFFLYLHLVEPHYPYGPREQFSARLGIQAPPEYVERRLDLALDAFYADPAADLAALERDTRHQLDLYDAEILEVDTEIGRILDLLAEFGLAEDTVVAITSDHGEEFLENGWIGHHSQLFDAQTRVPLLFFGPGVPAGLRVEHPIENRHLAPTLLGLAGIAPAANLRGPDLLEIARGMSAPPSGVFLSNSQARWADLLARRVERRGQTFSLIEDGWRLMWSLPLPGTDQEDRLALFDLANDPECRTDVAAEHAERVAYLRGRIQAWLNDGLGRRPWVMPAAEGTLEMLRDLGYIGD